MKRKQTSAAEQPEKSRGGYRVSSRPVIRAQPIREESPAGLGELPASYGRDVLYALARDPQSIFLYWDLNWAHLFAAAGENSPTVHIRVVREDETEEATHEIDPARGFCFLEVAAAGASYSCELGFFSGTEWKGLIRSNATATPSSEMSEEAVAEFAALPMHLSFQRMLDMIDTSTERENLASSVAKLQSQPASSAPNGAAELANFSPAEGHAEAISPETAARWRDLAVRFGGSSWGGSS